MKDKRTSKRSPIELAASFGIGEDPRPEREARIDNISRRGFCFVSKERLKIGQRLQIVVCLDTQEEVILSGRVMWTQKLSNFDCYRVGVEIDETDGPDFERFMEFYKKQI